MLIAIISDSHDNIPRIEQTLKLVKEKNIDTIIHCGDVATIETLKYFSQNFNGKIYLSFGNADITHNFAKEKINLKNIVPFEDFGETTIDDLKIAFVHFPEIAKKLGDEKKYDFVFYGHTHKPWEETIDNLSTDSKSTKIINPGTLAGMFNRATLALLDTVTKNIELVIL